MNTFTPGRWHVRNRGPHWNNAAITNYDIAWSDDGELVAEHVYERADAQLMAASKELLAALKLCASVLSGDALNKSVLIDALMQARDAITKAEAA